jgi:hypothetical protein
MRLPLPLAALLLLSCTLSDPDWSNSSEAGMTDLAVVDLASATADLGGMPPDLDSTYTTVPGCVGLGRAVGSAFACPGTFAAGGASKLCASGYTPLADGTKISDPDCRGLGGFFVGTPLLSRYTAGMPNSGVCGALPGVGQIRQFAGCGKTRNTVVDVSCSGFRQAIDLVPDPAWDASGNTLAEVSNSSAQDGVLCFK